jgi:hypothetical protein
VRPTVLWVPLLMACTAGGEDSGTRINECGDPEDTLTIVVSTIGYMRAENGVSWGFDIDGSDSSVCGHADYVSPVGISGIDNGLASLIPALEASEAKVIEGLLNSTIIEGRLLLAVELSRVDDPYDDDCVDVEFFQAYGDPLLGTDGGILSGQTLMRNPDTPTSKVEGMSIDCGVVEAYPMDIDLPLSILDASFELNLTRGGIQLNLGEDGFHSGFFTGSAAKGEITEIVYSSNGIDDDLVALVEGLLDTTLDMDPDAAGDCTELSAGLEFEAGEIYISE